MTRPWRVLIAVMALVVSLGAGLGAMAVVAVVGRSEPGPCRDTVIVNREASAMCAAPEANPVVVIGAGVVVTATVLGLAAAASSMATRRARADGTI